MLKRLTTCLLTAILVSSPFAASAQSELSEADRDYLSVLNESLEQDNNPLVSTMSDADKLSAGYYMCQQLDSGTTVESLVKEWESAASSIEDEQASTYFMYFGGAVLGGAVHTFCPQHLSQAEAYFNAIEQEQ